MLSLDVSFSRSHVVGLLASSVQNDRLPRAPSLAVSHVIRDRQFCLSLFSFVPEHSYSLCDPSVGHFLQDCFADWPLTWMFPLTPAFHESRHIPHVVLFVSDCTLDAPDAPPISVFVFVLLSLSPVSLHLPCAAPAYLSSAFSLRLRRTASVYGGPSITRILYPCCSDCIVVV